MGKDFCKEWCQQTLTSKGSGNISAIKYIHVASLDILLRMKPS